MAGTYFPLPRTITVVTRAIVPTVTFSVAHGWVIGQILSFRVGTDFGMFQLDEQQGQVLTIPTTSTITIDIDTSTWRR